MRICWSIPVLGERLGSARGDMVRAAALIDALRADGHDILPVQDTARTGASVAVEGYRRIVKRIAPRRVALALRDLGRVRHFGEHGEELVRQVRAFRADVIIETQVGFASSGAQASCATGLPLVLDDCAPTREEIESGCGLPSLARRALAESFAAARIIAAPSAAIARELVADGAPVDRVRVVTNGVDVDAYARADRAAFRAKAGLGRRHVVAFAGSFQPWHRIDVLVDAFARAPSCSEAILLLLGDGPTRAAVIEAARQLTPGRHLLAPGAVSPADIPSWLTASDVGVLPGSNDYGHPMKLVEYAAAGLARIAPDLVPVREALDDDVDGLLFPPGDAAALASRLDEVLGDAALRTRLGRAARTRVAGESWAAKARALVAGIAR